MEEYERQQKLDEKKGVVEPDETMMERLIESGLDSIGVKKTLIAVKNKSLEDAFDYYYSNIDKPNFLTQSQSTREESKKKKRKPRYIPLELQRLFSQLDLLNQKAISTQG